MPQRGVLYSWSVVHVAPKPWATPYVIGYVDLPNRVRVFSHIGGAPEDLQIDMPVQLQPAHGEGAGNAAADGAGAQPPFLFSPIDKGAL
jgi:uncharacterized OB-fold protein